MNYLEAVLHGFVGGAITLFIQSLLRSRKQR